MMIPQAFARTSKPPYYAVIFASQRRLGADDGYAETAARMAELAAAQPGYLGVESTRDAEGFGITVSYWSDEASILAWRQQVEHAQARARGREVWYQHYELRVARVERAYGTRQGGAE
jgi:heme-degrading monooxygenase HmoA